MSLLKSFIIGSSLPTTLHFLLKVMSIPENKLNYTYKEYSIIAPLYLGLMNAISLSLQKRYRWTIKQRFLYISIISGIFVFCFAKINKSYNFNDKEWFMYGLRILAKHFITYNLIICPLEFYLK